ncbi:MAG: glycine cleavage system protein T [Rhodospirillaceae bacterium]|nr:glycine cleavage system protein T [Rhodospirillaceae bacterium]MAX61019.1 glycine cleavage system protein T [Rhodospirillaceae bacterium]MBB55760.1 glycine cleavage system protein T [Rhodospirillaceae bacterium]|tara:strand:+ start:186276 stop:188690 length:2415 start_codon:yes stop_codon:yes gene_type:complete
MKSQYRVVVIGGGVVGASVLYHLAKFGWTDVALVERSILTAGSSWHAAGGIHALNADPNMAALQAYTIDLLAEIEKESGQDIGLHMTGGITVASAPARWEWLQSAYRIFQTIGIEDCHLMTPEEIKARCPIMDVTGVIGGLWADREGYIDTTGTVHAYAKAAKMRGAEVIENNKVEELIQRPDGSWDVVTEKGTIHAEHVVNAGGLWAKQVGRMVGLDLPLSPLEHHYLVTDSIPEIEALDFEVPMTVDLEGFTYLRQDQKGVLLGIYEVEHKHWNMDGAPWDYGFELIQEDFDRIETELTLGFKRYPCLQEVGVKRWVNGAFTFSPDGNPLVGPVPGKRNYWLACGVMAGFLQGGGVGKSLAEWMIHGEPEADAWPMDIARYGAFASNREYIKQTTGQFYSRRFVMTYPNEQLPAGRPLKKAPAYDAMTAAGAKWGCSWGLEVPLMFGPPGFEETPTLKRSNAFDVVAEECKAVRETVGLLDISGFSRFEVSGPEAETWLNTIMASRLPKPGRAKLAPMLSPEGRLKGDLTVFNWGDGTWWIMGSYYLRAWHMRWFQDHRSGDVTVRDISDAMVGFSLAGPNSRKVLEKLTHQDISHTALPFMGCMELDIGLIRAKVARLSVCGELGYEINVPAVEHIALREMLLDAGSDQGMREYGFYAMNALRLEKSFGIWSREFTQGYTPGQTGMDRWIDWQKPDFIGRKAALAERDAGGAATCLVTLAIDSPDAEVSGYEPVWQDGVRVGYVTSGGYGHTIGTSLAMALVERPFTQSGTELTVHVVGVERKAKVIAPSPYDPDGARMRL